jgi:4-aminobutyrate aminotransferase/(S)-3-amino-2-methylpropionate transaminase
MDRANYQGDPMRALQARRLISLIDSHSLVSHTASTGTALHASLSSIFAEAGRGTDGAQNLRGEGKGTFLSWDMKDGPQRDAFVNAMKKQGVLMGGCGERTVRLRPMLTFGEKQMGVLSEAVRETLKGM